MVGLVVLDHSAKADMDFEQTTDALNRLSLCHDQGLDRNNQSEVAVFNFGDLPVDLQHNILHRAFVDSKTLARCECVSKGWLKICSKLTFSYGGFRSKHHEGDSFSDEPNLVGVEHYHRIFLLRPSDLFLVVRTGGRKHRGGFSLKFQDGAGSPCSLKRWLRTSQQDDASLSGVVAQQSFDTTCKSRLALRACGIEVLFRTVGRKHQGEVKLVVGDSIETEDHALCSFCEDFCLDLF